MTTPMTETEFLAEIERAKTITNLARRAEILEAITNRYYDKAIPSMKMKSQAQTDTNAHKMTEKEITAKSMGHVVHDAIRASAQGASPTIEEIEENWTKETPVGMMVAHAAGGWGAVKRTLVPVVIIGAVMGAVMFLVVVSGPWFIGSFIGALAGLIVSIPIALRSRKNSQVGGELNYRELLIALSGYIILLVVTLAVRLIPGVKAWLGGINCRFNSLK